MKRIIIVGIQFLLFFAILLFLNGCSWFFLLWHDSPRNVNQWEKLPSFKNQLLANDLWEEYQSIQNEYVPFSGWKQVIFKGKYINTNIDGERNTPLDTSSAGKNIIRLFGGSTMWGVGAVDNNTIPAILQREHKNYKVYNHGIQAFNSRQGFDRLITLYQLNNRADYVIFYDGVNEISMCANTIDIPGHYESDVFKNKLTEIKKRLSKIEIIKQGFYDIFIKNLRALVSRVYNKLFPSLPSPEKIGYICDCDSTRTQKIAKLLITNWEMAKVIVESKGGKFIAILQPVSAVGKPNIEYLNLEKNNQSKRLQMNYVKLYAAIKKEIAMKKYNWIYDLSGVLNGKNAYYLDWCHVNSQANEIISNEIDEILRVEYINRIILKK